jgi:hypothetical protein
MNLRPINSLRPQSGALIRSAPFYHIKGASERVARADRSDAPDISLLYARPLEDKRVMDAFIPRTIIIPILPAAGHSVDFTKLLTSEEIP